VLQFSEGEAFVSILSVTAFVGALLDQMLQRLAYEETSAIEKTALPKILAQRGSEPLIDRVVYLLSQVKMDGVLLGRDLEESELVGAIHALLTAALPEITVTQQPRFSDDVGSVIPDFLLEQGDSRLVLEVKKYRHWSASIDRSMRMQVARLLHASHASAAVALLVPSRDVEPVKGRGVDIEDHVLSDDRHIVTVKLMRVAKPAGA
jgi:hypothetical protein